MNGMDLLEWTHQRAAPHLPKSESFGYVHSVETSAAVDGPGMRYLLFVSGCNFRCQYCHNCDTWNSYPEQSRTLDEVMAGIGKYAPFLKRAGGLTISGGEPLTQAAFVGAIFREAKRRWGLHTALDTQGSLAYLVPDSWFEPVDLVLLDIKHIDPEQHRVITGRSNEQTLAFARRLSDLGKSIWLRYVMVPGLTDRVADAERLADFVSTLKTIERVEVLPFHQLGAHKWKERGIPYPLETVDVPLPEAVEAVREAFRRHGLLTY
jgi:pyruvate formate lyase activating enzyme